MAFLIPNLLGGGAERVVSELLEKLPDNFERYLIIFEKKIVYSLRNDVKVINLNLPASKNPVKKFVIFLLRVYRARRIRKYHNFNIVLSFLGGANLVNLFSHSGNMKTAISVRNMVTRNGGFYAFVQRMLFKKLYEKAKTIIVVSKGVKRDLIENLHLKQERIAVIYNPCNIEKIQYSSQEIVDTDINFKNSAIITVGAMNKQKGQWHLIRVFKEIKREVKDAILLILGNGILKDYLNKLAQESGYYKNIYLLGFQTNPFKFLERSKVFVLPSIWEGFPNALVEAMACGKPVIATDCDSGPREILAPHTSIDYKATEVEFAEYGVLVPPLDGRLYSVNKPLTKSESLLAKAMIALLKNQYLQEKYSLLALERAKDFEINKIISNYTGLFYKLIF